MNSRNNFIKGVVSIALSVGMVINAAKAQTPTPSFAIIGHLEQLDVSNLADPLSAGSMIVNGTRIILPRNLLIKMPGQYLTVNDLFRGKHPGKAPALAVASKPSGLALADLPPDKKPPVPFEVEVLGNVIGTEYIAGWVSIAQLGLHTGAGFIQSIDYATGTLIVGPEGGPPMARVRINDPRGTYGKPNSSKGVGSVMDDRFAADPGNAPVVSQTGFPMCIPLSAAGDSDCPLTNRGAGGTEKRFTCGPVSVDPTAPARSTCQPSKKAPLVVGDYITYSGMLTEETPGAGNFFIAAHAVSSLTGIYTSPGADPAYVLIEEAIIGTLGAPFLPLNDFQQEQTSRFVFVGFTTDPTRRVEVFVIDTSQGDPDEQERRLTTLDPQRVGQIGRIRITLPAKANFLPITRDVRIRIEGHSSVKVAGGLDSGQYTAPVAEYIYPENTRWGIPQFPVSVPFENFCFLKNGGGTLGTLGRDELPNPHPLRPVIGALLPFPSSGQGSQAKADGTTACP